MPSLWTSIPSSRKWEIIAYRLLLYYRQSHGKLCNRSPSILSNQVSFPSWYETITGQDFEIWVISKISGIKSFSFILLMYFSTSWTQVVALQCLLSFQSYSWFFLQKCQHVLAESLLWQRYFGAEHSWLYQWLLINSALNVSEDLNNFLESSFNFSAARGLS